MSIPAFIVIGSLPIGRPRGFSNSGAPTFGLISYISWERLPVEGSLIKLYHLNLATLRASFSDTSAQSFYVSGFITWNYSSLMC